MNRRSLLGLLTFGAMPGPWRDRLALPVRRRRARGGITLASASRALRERYGKRLHRVLTESKESPFFAVLAKKKQAVPPFGVRVAFEGRS